MLPAGARGRAGECRGARRSRTVDVGSGDDRRPSPISRSLLARGATRAADARTELARGARDCAGLGAARARCCERLRRSADAELPALIAGAVPRPTRRAWRNAIARARCSIVPRSRAPAIDDPEALRRLALAAAGCRPASRLGGSATRGVRCGRSRQSLPLLWPRRTAGDALRVAYLIAPGAPLARRRCRASTSRRISNTSSPRIPRDRFAASSSSSMRHAVERASVACAAGHARRGAWRRATRRSLARALGEADYDALIDLAGMRAGTGRVAGGAPARTLWTLSRLARRACCAAGHARACRARTAAMRLRCARHRDGRRSALSRRVRDAARGSRASVAWRPEAIGGGVALRGRRASGRRSRRGARRLRRRARRATRIRAGAVSVRRAAARSAALPTRRMPRFAAAIAAAPAYARRARRARQSPARGRRR